MTLECQQRIRDRCCYVCMHCWTSTCCCLLAVTAEVSIVFTMLHQYAHTSNTWFFWPTGVCPPNGILIGSSVFRPPTTGRRTWIVQLYLPGGASVHYNRSICFHYKNLHDRRSISSHYKINIILDLLLPIANLHYERSILCNAKYFSLIT